MAEVDNTVLKRTPLYKKHIAAGGKMVPFAGWEMPVWYSSITAEHNKVRQQAGLFDVSHMGEIFVGGKQAKQALSYLTCNDLENLYPGKAQYSAIINPAGGVVDDIIIYMFSGEYYMLCVNASNAAKDFKWLKDHNQFDAVFEDQSPAYGQVALQGPQALEILKPLCVELQRDGIRPFHFSKTEVAGLPAIVARTGYTGEDGFEIFISKELAADLWDALIEAGRECQITPIGLGARDSLRLEACYPLHGHELREDVTAIESGLGWIVKPEKGDFIGKEILAEQKKKGAGRKLAAFLVDDPGIVREGTLIEDFQGKAIGTVTSGMKTPTVGKALGLALLDSEAGGGIGTQFKAVVRGRRLSCRQVKKPFYKRAK